MIDEHSSYDVFREAPAPDVAAIRQRLGATAEPKFSRRDVAALLAALDTATWEGDEAKKNALAWNVEANRLKFAEAACFDQLQKARRERDALAARVAALEGALRPFALASDRYGARSPDDVTDSWEVNAHTGLTYRDLREARAALAGGVEP